MRAEEVNFSLQDYRRFFFVSFLSPRKMFKRRGP
jgi:hypothetical protein